MPSGWIVPPHLAPSGACVWQEGKRIIILSSCCKRNPVIPDGEWDCAECGKYIDVDEEIYARRSFSQSTVNAMPRSLATWIAWWCRWPPEDIEIVVHCD